MTSGKLLDNGGWAAAAIVERHFECHMRIAGNLSFLLIGIPSSHFFEAHPGFS